MVHRGPLFLNEETGKYDDFTTSEKCFRARVGDRIYPGGKISFPYICFVFVFRYCIISDTVLYPQSQLN